MMNGAVARLLVVLLGLAATASAVAESADQRFLAGLRERGLFRLAERYCLKRLEREELAEARRADLVIELSRTLAERAVSSPLDEREPLWQRASQVTEDFARQFPESPRLLLVRLQGALGLLTRGELARQEAQLVAAREHLLGEARSHLREAIRALRELADETERQLRQQSLSGREDPARLSSYQLASIQKNIQYQLARAFRNQAQCYAADSPDRANSLTQAVKLLDPLAKLDPADPLAFKSRLDLIAGHRLLGDYPTARRMLDAILKQEPPPEVVLRARAEWIRTALAAGRLDEATSVLAQGRQIENVTSAELDYAWLETYLAAWRAAANDHAAATQWQDKATAMVEAIEGLYGPYWTRRAEMRLAGYVRTSPGGGNLAMLIRAAESSFRSGRLDDALAAYDRARRVAAEQGDGNGAFDLGYVAATIEHRRDRHDQAMARYRQIATTTPGHPKAAEAHLLAIYHAGRLAKARPQDAVQEYASLLQEHLQTWPEGPSAGQVRELLGRLHEHRHRWGEAIAAYRAVPPDAPGFLRAVEGIERCCRQWLSEQKAAGQPTEQIARDAADWFESLIVGSEKRWPQQWSPVARSAALAAARLRLNYTPDGYARAESLLSAALQGAGDAPPEWKSAAGVLLALSLGRMMATAEPKARPELARLLLDTIQRLRDGRMSEADRRSLDRLHAQALADAGRVDEALASYERLSAAYPRDGAIQEACAELLSARTDDDSLKTALARWRDLEKKSPPRSPRWFRAKYSVAWLHYRLGNPQQAAKMVALLKLLHPELGGEVMKEKFEKLETACRQ